MLKTRKRSHQLIEKKGDAPKNEPKTDPFFGPLNPFWGVMSAGERKASKGTVLEPRAQELRITLQDPSREAT